MRAEDKAKMQDAWARYFERNPDVAADYARVNEEARGHVPPDTRPLCAEPGCMQRALTHEDGAPASRRCSGHFVDGVL